MRRITRRRALAEAAATAGGLAVALAGCGGSSGSGSGPGSSSGSGAASGGQPPGSTLASTWVDPRGTGQLQPGRGEGLVSRTELGPAVPTDGPALATLAHITDAHVLDASSPARVTFLDRLGAPFQSTFRPQEALTAQVLAGAANAVRALRPALVLQGGDLIDNDQSNELAHALAALRGGRVAPGRYSGVQLSGDTDPFYYRPDVDAPRHPGLLREAGRTFTSRAWGRRWRRCSATTTGSSPARSSPRR